MLWRDSQVPTDSSQNVHPGLCTVDRVILKQSGMRTLWGVCPPSVVEAARYSDCVQVLWVSQP